MLLRSPISVDPRATFEFGGHVFSIYEFPKVGTGLAAHTHTWGHWTFFLEGGVRVLDGESNAVVKRRGDAPMLWAPGVVHGFSAVEIPAAIVNITKAGQDNDNAL